MIQIIEMNKKYRYRTGPVARILCVNAPGDPARCVISIQENGHVHHHTRDGCADVTGRPHADDLVEVKEPRRVWLNIANVVTNYPAYSNKQDAEAMAGPCHDETGVEFVEVLKTP